MVSALEKVADILDPVLAISPTGDDRLFIVAKRGQVRIVDAGGTLLATPFLDVSGIISRTGERGLLGLAFHPDYATNRKFYVNFTNTAGDTIIREYRASAVDPIEVLRE